MLSPALIDGIPNLLYEATTSGAFPDPFPTGDDLPLVKHEEQVVFELNALYA
jgi:hypothetical protein